MPKFGSRTLSNEVNQMDRRSFIRLMSISALAVAAPFCLPGCGGGGSKGGDPGSGDGTTLGTAFTLDRSEITSGPLSVSACWASGDGPCAIAETGVAHVQVHDDRAQLLSVIDSAGGVHALTVSSGTSHSRSGGGLACDASTTAVAMVFSTPGIMTTDPDQADLVMSSIRSLSSFPALVASIRRSNGIASPEAGLAGLAMACVDEMLSGRSRPRSGGENLFFADWVNGYSQVRLQNSGWRAVSVHRRATDGGGGRTGGVDLLTQVFPGAIPGSWGSLFTGTAGQPYSQTVSSAMGSHVGATTVQYWVQGPGSSNNAAALPGDVQRLRSPVVWSTLLYIVLPLIDFVGGSTRAIETIGSAEKLRTLFDSFNASGNAISAGEAADTALRNGDHYAAAVHVVEIVLDIFSSIGPILEALGFGGIAAAVLKAALAVFSVAFGIFNVSLAIVAWSVLPFDGHVDLGVLYRHEMQTVNEGKGNPPYDWTHSASEDVPFGEYRAQLGVGSGSAPGITTAHKDFSDVPVRAVHVMQKTNNSTSVTQNTNVGIVRAVFADGGTTEAVLVEGVNTAEWAWEREDKLGNHPRHNLPTTDYPQRASDASVPGGSYGIKHFYLRLNGMGADGPRRLRRLELEMYANGLPSNFGIDIYGITIEASLL